MEELVNECERCKIAQRLIETWVNKQGHDRCWYFPELFEDLAKLYRIDFPKTLGLPSREEFECGCKKYQDEQYGGFPS